MQIFTSKPQNKVSLLCERGGSSAETDKLWHHNLVLLFLKTVDPFDISEKIKFYPVLP